MNQSLLKSENILLKKDQSKGIKKKLPKSPSTVLLGDIFDNFVFPNNFPTVNADTSLMHTNIIKKASRLSPFVNSNLIKKRHVIGVNIYMMATNNFNNILCFFFVIL